MKVFDSSQQEVADAPNKQVRWLIRVDNGTVYYFSTAAFSYGGNAYLAKLDRATFNGPGMNRNRSEVGVIAANEFTFNLWNADGTHTAAALEGSTVEVDLLMTYDGVDEVMRSWKFYARRVEDRSENRMLRFICDDILRQHIRGFFPEDRFARDLFPSLDMRLTDEALTKNQDLIVPWVIGTGFSPLQSVFIPDLIDLSVTGDFAASVNGSRCTFTRTSGDSIAPIEIGRYVTFGSAVDPANNDSFLVVGHPSTDILEFVSSAGIVDETGDTVTVKQGLRVYLLGRDAETFTVTKVRSPKNSGGKSEWLSSGFTFTTYTANDDEPVTWKLLAPIIADVDRDGTPDAIGVWADGNTFHPAPFEVAETTKSSLSEATDAIKALLEAFGVASGDIDAAAKAAAEYMTSSSTTNIEINGSFFTRWDRQTALAMFLNIGNIELVIEDSIYMRWRDRTSVKTLTSADILTAGSPTDKSTFSYHPNSGEEINDSAEAEWFGYVTEEVSAISTVTTKTAKTKPSGDIFKLNFQNDYVHMRNSGTMMAQVRYLQKGKISFEAKSGHCDIECGDIITINDALYGASVDVMVDRMSWDRWGDISIEALVFSDDLDNWEDLNFSAVSFNVDDGTKRWEPAYGGPLTEEPVITSGFGVSGDPYLVIGPDTNRAKYTDFLTAINDLETTRHAGIFVLDGTYDDIPQIYLPNRPVEIIGESLENTILKNTAGSHLFRINGSAGDIFTSTYRFSNFTIESNNITGGTYMIFSNQSNEAHNTGDLIVDRVRFNLFGSTYDANSDRAVHANHSQGSVTIKNCEMDSGGYVILIYNYNTGSVRVEANRISNANKYAALLQDCKDIVVARNIVLDFYKQGLSLFRASAVSERVIFDQNVVKGKDLSLSSGANQWGIYIYDVRGLSLKGNSVTLVHSMTDAGVDLGFHLVDLTGASILGNEIFMEMNRPDDSNAFNISGLTRSALLGNTIHLNNPDTTAGKYHRGFYVISSVARCVIAGNDFDLVNNNTRDFGIDLTGSTANNEGAGNITYRCGTGIADTGTGNNVTGQDV